MADSAGMADKVFYFGCTQGPGHYMHASQPVRTLDARRALSDFERSNPWGLRIDTKLAPTGEQIEGRALLHHKDGWTALSFWDRSVDRRSGSCSTFLAQGEHDFERMLHLTRTHFPAVMARFAFSLVKA
jgi:hypothetical protein